MYVIQFEKNKKVTINFEESFSIFDGIAKLREWNKDAKTAEEPFIMHYKVVDDVREEAVLRDRMTIGAEYNFDFFQVTKNRLKNLYEGEELENILGLLEKIEAQYQVEKDEYYANLNIEIHDDIVSNQIEEIQENPEYEKESKRISTKQKAKNKIIKKKKGTKQEKVSISGKIIGWHNEQETPSKTYLRIALGFLVFLMFLLLVLPNFSSSTEEAQTFDELLLEYNFKEALEDYPYRYAEIAGSIVELGEDGIPFLEKFIEMKEDYPEAQFDLAFLKKDYEKVIDLANYVNTDQRRAHVAIALIHEDELDEAVEFTRIIEENISYQRVMDEYLSHIIENLTREEMETAEMYREYANNTRINDFVSSFVDIHEEIIEIESLPPNERSGFFTRRNLSNLRAERSELLDQETVYIVEIEKSTSSILLPLLIALSLLLVAAGGIYFFLKKKQPNSKIKGFEELLRNKLYISALKQYPQKYPEIEREIFLLGEKGIPYLEEFISNKKSYKPAQFDLAFLKKEYEKVIELEKYADTDGRKSQLAISYIHTSQIDKANEINQYIEVPELDIYLSEHYYQLTVEAFKNEDSVLAREYQEKANSTDIDYLVETIQLIDDKIRSLLDSSKSLELSQEEKSRMNQLEEARASSLSLV